MLDGGFGVEVDGYVDQDDGGEEEESVVGSDWVEEDWEFVEAGRRDCAYSGGCKSDS